MVTLGYRIKRSLVKRIVGTVLISNLTFLISSISVMACLLFMISESDYYIYFLPAGYAILSVICIATVLNGKKLPLYLMLGYYIIDVLCAISIVLYFGFIRNVMVTMLFCFPIFFDIVMIFLFRGIIKGVTKDKAAQQRIRLGKAELCDDIGINKTRSFEVSLIKDQKIDFEIEYKKLLCDDGEIYFQLIKLSCDCASVPVNRMQLYVGCRKENDIPYIFFGRVNVLNEADFFSDTRLLANDNSVRFADIVIHCGNDILKRELVCALAEL